MADGRLRIQEGLAWRRKDRSRRRRAFGGRGFPTILSNVVGRTLHNSPFTAPAPETDLPDEPHLRRMSSTQSLATTSFLDGDRFHFSCCGGPHSSSSDHTSVQDPHVWMSKCIDAIFQHSNQTDSKLPLVSFTSLVLCPTAAEMPVLRFGN